MASISGEHNIESLVTTAEQVLQGNNQIVHELRAWADKLAEKCSEVKSLGISDSVPNLIALLLEELSFFQSRLEEQKARNETLEAALAKTGEREKELSDLYEVAKAITSRLDLSELVTVLEEKTKSLLDADACSLLIRDSKGYGLHIIGPGLQLARREPVPEHMDACEIEAARVAMTGVPVLLEDVPNCEFCRYKDLICTGGVHHMLSVPMRSHDRLVGAMNSFRLNNIPFDDSDMRTLSIIASAAAVAIENAEAYNRERNMADKLQLGIQPDSAFELPGFSVGCDYVPSSTDARVGGDFYDVVPLGDGKVGIVMADISGKGIEAAVYTAMVRFTLRGLMLSELDPGQVMSRLNDAVCAFVPDEIFVTLFYGVLDTQTREIVFANAGHDHPIVFIHSKCSFQECEVTGRAIGMLPGEVYESGMVTLCDHDLIVLFTDGITEARRDKVFFGTDRIKEVILETADLSAPETVAALFAEVRTFTGGSLKDDAGVLVIKALPVFQSKT